MPKLPRLTARQIDAVLEKAGFSKILHPKVLKSILRDAEISVERLNDLL